MATTATPVTKPTLIYSTRAGLAETARVLLEDAGVDYDYVAIADWAVVKAQYQASGKAPFGQFPIYEEPLGLVVAQSSAITLHLARQHGYYGANSDEAALIDQAAEGVIDIRTRFGQDVHMFRATDEKTKAQFLSEYFPSQLEVFTTLLAKNGNNGFLVGSKVRCVALQHQSSLLTPDIPLSLSVVCVCVCR
jgi:glutathione S-transferase